MSATVDLALLELSADSRESFPVDNPEIGKLLMAQWAAQVKKVPVAGVARFATEEQAVHAANDTPYGLAAYYSTRDMARIWRLSEALEYEITYLCMGGV